MMTGDHNKCQFPQLASQFKARHRLGTTLAIGS